MVGKFGYPVVNRNMTVGTVLTDETGFWEVIAVEPDAVTIMNRDGEEVTIDLCECGQPVVYGLQCLDCSTKEQK
jgi:hypothetical protein